jgi:hypothetical protein
MSAPAADARLGHGFMVFDAADGDLDGLAKFSAPALLAPAAVRVYMAQLLAGLAHMHARTSGLAGGRSGGRAGFVFLTSPYSSRCQGTSSPQFLNSFDRNVKGVKSPYHTRVGQSAFRCDFTFVAAAGHMLWSTVSLA